MNESNEIEFEYVFSNKKNLKVKIKEDSGFIYNKDNKQIIKDFLMLEKSLMKWLLIKKIIVIIKFPKNLTDDEKRIENIKSLIKNKV